MKNQIVKLLIGAALGAGMGACTFVEELDVEAEKVTQVELAAESDWLLLWTTQNVPNPEGVTYDPSRNILFISNQYLSSEPGKASIGKMTLNGAVIEQDWVSGLTEPKGMAIRGDKLFVSDVTSLVEIDINAGEISQRYDGPSAEFLNDVTIDQDGNVYVSDMFTSAIYKLDEDGNFDIWVQDPALENPNGLLVDGDAIIVAAWGNFSDGNPMVAPHGGMHSVSIFDKTITPLSDGAFGNLDGLQKYGAESYLVSDWISGGVKSWSPSDGAKDIIQTPQSSGDIAYLPEHELIFVPMALEEEVRAYGRRAAPDRQTSTQ